MPNCKVVICPLLLHCSTDVYPPSINRYVFLAVAMVKLLQMFVPITYGRQKIWIEIKGKFNQLEGSQMRWALSQTLHCYVLIILKAFTKPVCSLCVYIMMLFIFSAKLLLVFPCECLVLNCDGWQYPLFYMAFLSVSYFLTWLEVISERLSEHFLVGANTIKISPSQQWLIAASK